MGCVAIGEHEVSSTRELRQGPSSCGSYETGDKGKGRILWAVPWYRTWLHKEFYVQRNIYDRHELGPKKSVPMGLKRMTDSLNKSN